MASPAQRLPTNAPGPFFVDASCIDCGTCNWVAPASFDEAGDYSRVYRQPAGPEEARRAEMALVACPVGAIGAEEKRDLEAARAAFPERIADEVFHCGWHARESFGAASYLIVRPDGNVLVDSPRFSAPLVRRIEEMGGVRWMVLTHQDDVADHARFAAHFGCERVLHEDDVQRGTRDVEIKVEGTEPVALAPDLTLIPVPGHTRGSICLLYRDTFLFTGDHLAWSERLGHLYAFRDACWYSWERLAQSMARLARFRFEWVLPGHGRRFHAPAERMTGEMQRCLDWIARER